MCWLPWLLVVCHQLATILAGCWQGRPQCCPGRNMSCASIETGFVDHSYKNYPGGSHSGMRPDATDPSFNPTIEEISPFQKPHQPSLDVDEEGSGNTADDVFIQNPTSARPGQSRAQTFVNLYQTPQVNDIEIEVEEFSGVDWARLMSYEVIEQPFVISGDRMNQIRYDRASRVPTENVGQVCYCDADCRTLGDCCSDYETVCPTRDCRMTTWSAWSDCHQLATSMYAASRRNPDITAQDNVRDCSRGIRQRHRLVTNPAENGGRPCLPTIEEKVCPNPIDGECRKAKEEVSIVLPYRHSSARLGSYRSDLYYDHPNDVAELNQIKPSCSTFEVTWISPNCRNLEISRNFTVGSSICAECQARAKYPHENRKCAGDGVLGLDIPWMMAKDQDCQGLWAKQSEKPDCTCGLQSALPSYLLV